eukprot:2235192-Ditylum_brightwellii.AAC.1
MHYSPARRLARRDVVRKSTWKVKGGEDGGGWQAARDGSARVRRPPGPSLLVDARLRGRGCVGDGS